MLHMYNFSLKPGQDYWARREAENKGKKRRKRQEKNVKEIEKAEGDFERRASTIKYVSPQTPENMKAKSEDQKIKVGSFC